MNHIWLGIGLLLACPLAVYADDDEYVDPERHQFSGMTFHSGLGMHVATVGAGLETRGFHVDSEEWVGIWDMAGRVEAGLDPADPSPVAGFGGRIRFGALRAPGAAGGCDIMGGARATIEGEARSGAPDADRFNGGVDATTGMLCVLSDDSTLIAAAELGSHAVVDSAGDELEARAGGRVTLAIDDDLLLETALGRSLFGDGTYGEISVRGRVSDKWLLGVDVMASDRSQAASLDQPGGRATNVQSLLTVTRGL